MAKRKAITGAGTVGFNMTPMIDCTFQLIILFILAGQFASQTLERLEIYGPIKSQAQKWSEEKNNRVIVNVPSLAEDQKIARPGLELLAKGYYISGRQYDAAALTDELKRISAPHLEANKEFFVEIRADRRVGWGEIWPVLQAAADAKIKKLNLTALLESR